MKILLFEPGGVVVFVVLGWMLFCFVLGGGTSMVEGEFTCNADHTGSFALSPNQKYEKHQHIGSNPKQHWISRSF